MFLLQVKMDVALFSFCANLASVTPFFYYFLGLKVWDVTKIGTKVKKFVIPSVPSILKERVGVGQGVGGVPRVWLWFGCVSKRL